MGWLNRGARPVVRVYTDGSAHCKDRSGGWAAIVLVGGQEHELSGYASDTTNNRMEMQAALEALLWIKERSDVFLYTDSQYLRTGITQWVPRWIAQGWATKEDTPVVNRDLWEALQAAQKRHMVVWQWVRGHSDDQLNNRCDQLASTARVKGLEQCNQLQLDKSPLGVGQLDSHVGDELG